MADQEIKTLICLPALNEADSIAKMITDIRALGLEPVVSDAGSIDSTREIAESMGVEVIRRQRPGKGWGIREVMDHAKRKGYDALGMIDCDQTYPTEKLPGIIAQLSNYDMVSGARSMQDIPFPNRQANQLFILLINIFFGAKWKDVQTGLRAFRIDKFEKRLTAYHFDLEVQISCIASKDKLNCLEIPITYKDRVGESKVRYIDAFKVLGRIFYERFTK